MYITCNQTDPYDKILVKLAHKQIQINFENRIVGTYKT